MVCRSLRFAVPALALCCALPAVSQPLPDYRDDRSTPQAVVESLYNAIERKEYARAWSYFRDEPERPAFQAFAEGYADTAHVRVRAAAGTSEGAVGSVYSSVPVVVEASANDGTTLVYAGCYELRMVQAANQIEPPFAPLGIVAGRLEPALAGFDEAEGQCPDEGL